MSAQVEISDSPFKYIDILRDPHTENMFVYCNPCKSRLLEEEEEYDDGHAIIKVTELLVTLAGHVYSPEHLEKTKIY